MFADKSCFCPQYHNGRIRVWICCREKLLNCCVMHCPTNHAHGVMVWDSIRLHFWTSKYELPVHLPSSAISLRFYSLLSFLSSSLVWSNISTGQCTTTCCTQCSSFFLSPPYFIVTMACLFSRFIVHWTCLVIDWRIPSQAGSTHGYTRWTLAACGCHSPTTHPKPPSLNTVTCSAIIDRHGGNTHYWFFHHPDLKEGCFSNKLILILCLICEINLALISLVHLGVAFWVTSSVKIGLIRNILKLFQF